MDTPMVTTILSDFSRVVLFPKDKSYMGTLNGLHAELTEKYGTYRLFDHFEFNDELLNYYKSLKSRCSVNIFTTGTIQNHPDVRRVIDPIFENIFTLNKQGSIIGSPLTQRGDDMRLPKQVLSKKDPAAYCFILEKLKRHVEEVVFIDDQEKNVEAAREAGITGVCYKSNSQVFFRIEKVNNGLVEIFLDPPR